MAEGDVNLLSVPLSHNTGFTTAAAGLLLGHHLVIMPRFDAARVPAPHHRAPGHVPRHGADDHATPAARLSGTPGCLRPVLDPTVLASRGTLPTGDQAGVDRDTRPRTGLGTLRRHRTSGIDLHLGRPVPETPGIGRRRRRGRDEGSRRRRQRVPARRGRRDLHAPLAWQRAHLPLRRRRRQESRRLGLARRPRVVRRRRLRTLLLPVRSSGRHVHRRWAQRLPCRDRSGPCRASGRAVVLGRRRARRRSRPGSARAGPGRCIARRDGAAGLPVRAHRRLQAAAHGRVRRPAAARRGGQGTPLGGARGGHRAASARRRAPASR